jgi:hypothetical protein
MRYGTQAGTHLEDPAGDRNIGDCGCALRESKAASGAAFEFDQNVSTCMARVPASRLLGACCMPGGEREVAQRDENHIEAHSGALSTPASVACQAYRA